MARTGSRANLSRRAGGNYTEASSARILPLD
jgi:hypothetical protein